MYTVSPLAKPGKRLTEDHYFMRSKTLHRDEDMLQDTLRAKVASFFPNIVCIVLYVTGAWEGRGNETKGSYTYSDTPMSVIDTGMCLCCSAD